jgi:hypothetical protein
MTAICNAFRGEEREEMTGWTKRVVRSSFRDEPANRMYAPYFRGDHDIMVAHSEKKPETSVPIEPAVEKKKKKKKKRKIIFFGLVPSQDAPENFARASSKAFAKMARAFADSVEEFVDDAFPKKEKDSDS